MRPRRFQLTHSEFEVARDINYPALEELADCFETGRCREAQKTVILLASLQFGYAMNGAQSGENVW